MRPLRRSWNGRETLKRKREEMEGGVVDKMRCGCTISLEKVNEAGEEAVVMENEEEEDGRVREEMKMVATLFVHGWSEQRKERLKATREREKWVVQRRCHFIGG
ncbi:hypothetical protein HAX54_044967, partial [Datura stramonium]|nr:hypothetical protein [Datura stramonium]